jgi:hypothetical protein
MKRRTQKGGLILKSKSRGKSKWSPKTAFEFFLAHSSITILSQTIKSSSGVIFRCRLREGVVSPYKTLRRPNRDVEEIIIKIVALANDSAPKRQWRGESFENPKEIEKLGSFHNEVAIQKDIFMLTQANFDPICPDIVYSLVLDRPETEVEFLNMLMAASHGDIPTVKMLNDFITNIESGNIEWLGVIGMEMAEGYRSLGDFYGDPRINLYENMARLRILELAYKTDYSQNDFNVGNILINPDLPGYYKDIPGHVLIIDFGFASKIPTEELNYIKRFYEAGNFVEALTIFQTLRRTDGARLDYFAILGWLYFRYNKSTNRPITLAKSKQKSFVDGHNRELGNLKIASDLATNERMAQVSPSHKTKKLRLDVE